MTPIGRRRRRRRRRWRKELCSMLGLTE